MSGAAVMRIVHVTVSDRFAGVERSMALSAKALSARGHEVTVIGGNPSSMRSHLEASDVEFRPGPTPAAAGRALARAMPADIVHAHMTNAELLALSFTVGRRPLFVTRHFAQQRGQGRGGGIARAVIERAPRHEISISKYTADRIGCPSTVVYHGVEERPQADLTATTVLVAQRLEPEKSTEDALLAWDRTGLGRLGWKLLVAGDGSDRARLERLARELQSTPSIEFLGHVSDLSALRSRCSIQLATPRGEHFGLSVLESMAWGVPVVAADAGAHREVIGPTMDALAFDPGDVDGAMKRLCELAADASLRLEIGQALQRRQRRVFGLDAHALRLEQLYAAALGARH